MAQREAGQPGMHPPCPFAGFQCEGIARCEDVLQDDYTVYYSKPYGNHIHKSEGIVIFPDIGGIWHGSRLLADLFAGCGYMTVVANTESKVRREHGTVSTMDESEKDSHDKLERRNHALTFLQNKGCSRIGLAGYGNGTKCVIELMDKERLAAPHGSHSSLYGAGFVASIPVDVLRDLRGTFQVHLENAKWPLSIAVGDEELAMNASRRLKIEEWVKPSGQPYQVALYSHVDADFASRQAVHTKPEIFAKKQAFIQAITWFEEHLMNGD